MHQSGISQSSIKEDPQGHVTISHYGRDDAIGGLYLIINGVCVWGGAIV